MSDTEFESIDMDKPFRLLLVDDDSKTSLSTLKRLFRKSQIVMYYLPTAVKKQLEILNNNPLCDRFWCSYAGDVWGQNFLAYSRPEQHSSIQCRIYWQAMRYCSRRRCRQFSQVSHYVEKAMTMKAKGWLKIAFVAIILRKKNEYLTVLIEEQKQENSTWWMRPYGPR